MTTESMPPLPDADPEVEPGVWVFGNARYTAAQMHAYAQAYAAQEVAKEREACAVLVESRLGLLHANVSEALITAADAIRSRP